MVFLKYGHFEVFNKSEGIKVGMGGNGLI